MYHVYVLCFLSRLGLPLLLGENRGSCLLEHLLLAIPTTLAARSALSALSALAAAGATVAQPAAALGHYLHKLELPEDSGSGVQR